MRRTTPAGTWRCFLVEFPTAATCTEEDPGSKAVETDYQAIP